MSPYEPGYLQLQSAGQLQQRVQEAQNHLKACDGCGWKCGVNRFTRKLGICRTGARAMVSSYGPHLGEEPVLTGQHGSGTIFFTRCSLNCQFCQNSEISQNGPGVDVSAQELAEIMMELQQRGCHNINLVSPSHVVPQIIQAVALAAEAGLHLPLVYNSGGYDSLESLRLLNGIIDIYLPDMKYASEMTAQKYSKVSHYPQTNQAAVMEMYRQVGSLRVDSAGVAERGLLVRHLVLPNQIAETPEIANFLAEEISPGTWVTLLSTYDPAYHARRYPELNRRITPEEYKLAQHSCQSAGLNLVNLKTH